MVIWRYLRSNSLGLPEGSHANNLKLFEPVCKKIIPKKLVTMYQVVKYWIPEEQRTPNHSNTSASDGSNRFIM